MPPESNDNRLLLDGKDSRLGCLGACREINDGFALLPLRDSLLLDPVALSEGSQALLTVNRLAKLTPRIASSEDVTFA